MNLETIAQNLKGVAQTHKFHLIGAASVLGLAYLSKKFYFDGGSFKSNKRLDGKTVIITGANTGIGKETALDLAKRGARVILACRDLSRGIKAAEEIRKETGNGNVFVEVLNLASLESVRAFSKKILSQEERIDILINNAGVMACPQLKTTDGFELQFGTNHLGHFLLTNLLLDKIKQSAPSRIVNVSARAYLGGDMRWDDLNFEKNYDAISAYCQSKLANILFTRELTKRLEGTNVTVSALHPGVIKSKLGRYLSETFGFKAILFQILCYPAILLCFKSPKQGAQTTLYCALSEDLNNVSGNYYSDCQEMKLLPKALNENDAKRLWEISEKLVNL